MKNIVITGGAGLIGQHICKKLVELGHNVYCFDNFITSTRKSVDPLLSDNFHLMEYDVINAISPKLFEDTAIDWILHLASPASPNHHSKISYHALPMETMMVNTQGTLNMLQLAKEHNARFLFTSTSEIYGDPLEHPQKETYNGNVSTTGPRSIYDEAKRFGETLCAYFHRDHDVDVRIARIFNTYGPGMLVEDKRMLVNFILQALENKDITVYGDGTQTRSLCYVEDTVEGIIRFIEKDNLNGEVINIGSPEEHSVYEYAEMIVRLTDSKSNITYHKSVENDPQKRRPDVSKAKKLLDWTPATSLQLGLKKTVEYYKNN